jgi:hypothetical protein
LLTGAAGPDADVLAVEELVPEPLDSAVVSGDDVELSEGLESVDDDSDVVVSEDVVSAEELSAEVVSEEEVSDDVVAADDVVDADAVAEEVVTLPTVVPTVGVPAVSLLPHAVEPTIEAAAITASHQREGRAEEQFMSCPSLCGHRPTGPGLQRR